MATRQSSFFPDSDIPNDLGPHAGPLRTDQIVTAVEAMLVSLGLPVIETHARYSKGSQGLIFSVSLAEPRPIQVLTAVEPMVASRVNRGRHRVWKTFVYWRYQLPVVAQPQTSGVPQLQSAQP
jgi:hypothetical protein